MSTYAVIGASRGLGLEFVCQLAARPQATVFVTVRSKETATHLFAAAKDLQNVHIIEADVADYSAMQRAAKQVSDITGGTLDCLIHNAARMGQATRLGYDNFPSMDALDDDFIETFKINSLGVIHSIKAFVPLLQASTVPLKKIVVISSGAADSRFILQADDAGGVAYGMTKAATLVAAAKWAVKLKKDNIVVISFHPGTVNTWETRGESGYPQMTEFIQKRLESWKVENGIHLEMITPAESVSSQLNVIDNITMEKTGLFLNYTGEEWSPQVWNRDPAPRGNL